MRKLCSALILFSIFIIAACNTSTSPSGTPGGGGGGSGSALASLTGKKMQELYSTSEIDTITYTTATAYTSNIGATGTYTYSASGSTSMLTLNQVTPTAGVQTVDTLTWTSSTTGTWAYTRHVSSTFSFHAMGTFNIIP